MHPNVIAAVFRRNFVSYFSNPTGYVFICVFVLLSAAAAFWPDEFFNSNLANLDQLNAWLPYIMLVFIPAITMSIWADERRQGTDELLLTLPATDFDVVLGKYLAALAIFTVSLLFSLSNLLVLWWLGTPDWGLVLGNYFGYWLVGAAMLSIGMVASFLTGNLTVGFVLGVLFNAPLVFAGSAASIFSAGNAVLRSFLTPERADQLLSPDVAQRVQNWGLAEQFRDFGRGVATLSSIGYFLLIIAVMLYLSMVLIGRRHWSGGRDGKSLGWQYLVRASALVVIAAAATILLTNHDRRIDMTAERLSSLSPKTIELLDKLDPKRPVQIDAYISPQMPESYVQTKVNLVSTLRELQGAARDKLQVRIHETTPDSPQAALAEEQYGIRPQRTVVRDRGTLAEKELFMGFAVTNGLEKIVVPFVDRGMPVEYELIRSIGTAAQEKRKTVGVLQTDAKLFGSFDMQRMMPGQNEAIIAELEKQYEVVQVDANSPITQDIDVLLAVQPSSLNPQAMENFIAAVKRGVPTAVFEDPFPYLDPSVPGTAQPKRPPMNPFGMGGGPPEPKGDIGKLWELLGIEFVDRDVVWQKFNPLPEITSFNDVPEFVFVQRDQEHPKAFNAADPVSAGLQRVLFVFAGAIDPLNASDLNHAELAVADRETGLVEIDKIMENSLFGRGDFDRNRPLRPTGKPYTLAARINGKLKAEKLEMSDEGSPEAAAQEAVSSAATATTEATEGTTGAAGATDSSQTPPAEASATTASGEPQATEGDKPVSAAKPAAEKPAELDVILVSDIDMLYSAFFQLRARGAGPDDDVSLDVDNVTFVLNVLDSLAKDDRFIDVRNRRRKHRTLERVEERTKAASTEATEARVKFNKDFDAALAEEQKTLEKQVEKVQADTSLKPIEKFQQLGLIQESGQKRLEAKTADLQKKRNQQVAQAERKLAMEVRHVQDTYKMMAVLLPPIPPLLIGLFVFFQRRSGEREGVTSTRLRGRR